LGYTPGIRDHRWIAWIDPKGRERAATATKNDIGALVRPVTGRCLNNPVVVNMRGSKRRGNATQAASIQQVRIAIFAECNDQAGRIRSRYVHQQWTRATQIGITLVK